jgi:ribosomal protein L29
MTTPNHDTDFYAWTQAQAAAIRAKDVAALDLEHLAEEIESLGMNEKRALSRQLQRLLAHLLKWRFQPTHRTPSWRRTIRQARDAIADVLETSHSLHDYPRQRLPLAYRRARRDAADDTGLPLATFPEACPWPIEQVLDEDFWPEEDR